MSLLSVPIDARAVRAVRFWIKGVAVLLLALGWATLSRQAYAQSVNITGQITADNNYEVCYGTAAAVTACIGNDNGWPTAESYTFPPLNATTDYIYIATWSDDAVAQGLLFQLQSGPNTLASGHPAVEVKATGQDLDAFDPAPGPATITSYLPGAWLAPFVGGANGMAPWGTITGIGSSARWIWHNSGNDPSAGAPLTSGFNHDEFLIFRIPAKALVPCKQLCGIKFHDANGNGVQDPGEPALPGWQIVLVGPNGLIQIATTDANGQYTFSGLPAGSYTLSEIAQPGWTQTAPATGSHTVTLQAGQIVTGLNFGNMPCKPHHEEQPDLTIKKHTEVNYFTVGQTTNYLLTVQNIGAGAATGPITISDYLPNGLTPTTSSWSVAGWTCTAAGQLVTCTHPGPLPPGYSATIPVSVLVGGEAAPMVENCAKIDNVNDLDYNNNNSCVQTDVSTPKQPDLTIRKWAEPQVFTAGSTAYYMVTVTNQGSGPTLSNSVMYDSLPAGVTPISVNVDPTPNNWSCLISGQDVQCELADPIAPGETYTFKIEVKVNQTDLQSLKNCAVTRTRIESDYTNNEACVETKIEQPTAEADLGDAPDSTNSFGVRMFAYPAVVANFPTTFADPAGIPGPIHWNPKRDAWLGRNVCGERDADQLPDCSGVTNIDPPSNAANRDEADDGVQLGTLTFPQCALTTFRYDVNIVVPGTPRYVNVWFDYNRDGDWKDTISCTDSAGVVYRVSEWAVRNQVVPTTLAAGYRVRTTPSFRVPVAGPNPDRPMWMRINLGEQRAPTISATSTLADGRGPANGYQHGETEDYLLTGLLTQPTTNVTAASADAVDSDAGVFDGSNDEVATDETEEDEAQSNKVYLPLLNK
ncbi:MAG: SdrD B-like domain-containing protein [Caldilineaceae bacterium]